MTELIINLGLIGILAVVFAENGLLIGFFLPGDSLLFTAGVLASQELLPIVWLTVGVVAMSIIGTQVGYIFGRKYGRKLFDRPDSRFFKKEYLHQAESYYAKHGSMTIVLARFIPVVRTFAPIIAGVAQMNFAKFLAYNILGGVVWAAGLTLGGYWLGSQIPSIDKYLLPVLAIIILLSIMPGIVHFLREPERRRSLWNIIRRKK
jgi:membrane-associated protein